MALSIVNVWLVRLIVPEPATATLTSVLDDDERQRADQLPAERRPGFVVAHGAARLIVGQHLSVPASRIRWERGPHGKPELAGAWRRRIRVNLSHSGDLAAVALTHWRAVGVDVQKLREVDTSGLAARFFPPTESEFVAAGSTPHEQTARFTRLWSRKEACVKAAGGRLVTGLKLPVREAGRVVRDPSGRLPEPYLVQDIPAPAGYHAAVALAGTEPFRVVRRWWQPPM